MFAHLNRLDQRQIMKLPYCTGTIVALLNPRLMPPKEDSKSKAAITFLISAANQLVVAAQAQLWILQRYESRQKCRQTNPRVLRNAP